MPSLSESRRQVEESLRSQPTGIDHDAVLAGLQDEIDKHNGIKNNLERSIRGSKRNRDERSQHRPSGSRRLRFKHGAEDGPERRKHRSRRHRERDHARPPNKRARDSAAQSDEEATEASHPFPREPTDPSRPDHHTDDAAFRDSLFDALADDEGAAYWESVYSQPIHVYNRPTVQTEQGELEQMSDEQYTAYVKTKMWEKKHPEVVMEREQTERWRKEEEEEKVRKREEFVRRKEQAAWERAQRRSHVDDDSGDDPDAAQGRRHKYRFAGEKEWSRDGDSSSMHTSKAQREEYATAWSGYLAAWDKLKHELLQQRQSKNEPSAPPLKASKRIPWPVLASKPVIKANIEDFMRHAPVDQERSVAHVLKAERVRWHPDKVQQRFGGEVDEGTMKIVTGVFQVVDSLLEAERARER